MKEAKKNADKWTLRRKLQVCKKSCIIGEESPEQIDITSHADNSSDTSKPLTAEGGDALEDYISQILELERQLQKEKILNHQLIDKKDEKMRREN